MAKRTRNAGVPVVRQLSDALDFDIYTVANRAPITGASRAQLACFFHRVSVNAPLLRVRDVHSGVERITSELDSSPGRGREQCD
jgi:hypothetical protein